MNSMTGSTLTANAHNTLKQTASAFDVERIRGDFPILHQQVHGKPLVYLDNAASTQKPQSVIDAVSQFYANDNANIHRGVHELSHRATAAYERTRDQVRGFLHAARREEIVFTRGATESINLVAQTFGRANLREGDEILITHMEHHSNIVPWQMVRDQTGAKLVVAPINDAGELIVEAFEKRLSPRTKVVAMAQVSNALGTVNPVKHCIAKAHEVGAAVLIDGAQAVLHMPVDVQDLGADFYALSSHKLFGPTGVGVLYARYDMLKDMPPYQGGGEMISSVTFEETTYNDLPHRFEAGTPDIAGVVGLGAAIQYVSVIGLDRIAAHERELLDYGTVRLNEVPGLRHIGTASEKAGVLSFVLDDVHPHDIGTIIDQEGVAVRTGHHCAQPVMDRFGVPATVRASFALYNTKEEIDALVGALDRVAKVFA